MVTNWIVDRSTARDFTVDWLDVEQTIDVKKGSNHGLDLEMFCQTVLQHPTRWNLWNRGCAGKFRDETIATFASNRGETTLLSSQELPCFSFYLINLAVHRGAFCQFPYQWIYYYGSNKSTKKETGKTQLCAVQWSYQIWDFWKQNSAYWQNNFSLILWMLSGYICFEINWPLEQFKLSTVFTWIRYL